ncbi:MAG TPA: hypothetical protein PKZ53_14735, partial [Acidobacteriota bacterium]|nr:hypothetical protein [Acidobacteriota bacterium]
EELKRFRAVLFQIEKDGPEGKRWGNSKDVIASIQGFANYVAMVNPEKGAEFQAQVKAIIQKYGWQRPASHQKRPLVSESQYPGPASSTTPEPPSVTTPEPESPKKDEKKWWKLF